MNHPNSIKTGYCPVINCHISHIEVKFSKLETKIDRRTGKAIEEEPKEIKNGGSVIAFIEPQKPLVYETYSTYPPLGRFAVRDMKMTVAVGVIKEITRREPNSGGETSKAAQKEEKKKKK